MSTNQREEYDKLLKDMQGELINAQGLTIELSNDIDELKQTVKEQGNAIIRLESELNKNNDFKTVWLKDTLAKIEKSNRKNKATDRRIAALEARFLTVGKPFEHSETDDDDSDEEE